MKVPNFSAIVVSFSSGLEWELRRPADAAR
jgi:hypothetical protein